MIEHDFVKRLKSELYFSNVGSEVIVRLAVLTNTGSFSELRIEELSGVIAVSDWRIEYQCRVKDTVDLSDYLSNISSQLKASDKYIVDYYLRSNYLVIVHKEYI